MAAAIAGKDDSIRLLVKLGAQLGLRTKRGMSPYLLAAEVMK